MASFEDALKVISDRLDTVPLALEQSAKAVQPSLLDSVLALVGQMEVDGGNLVANSDNLALVDSVIDAVRTTLLESDYVDAVGQFAGEYDTQKRLTDEYFNEEFGTFTAEEATTLLGRSKKQAVDRLVKVEFVNTGLYDPIRTRLDAAVSSGAPLRDTIRNLRIQINGGKVSATEERLGLLNRYVKQIAYDSFAVGNREYTKNVSEELGAEWFRYVGGIIDPPETKDGKPKTSGGTRPFCEVRNNEYWHYGEIQSWVGKSGNPKPSGDWSGKVAGTDKQTIFTYLGGWNCRHSIIPVVPTRVPKERLEEAMAEGFYKPSEREKQLLGLGGETPTPTVTKTTGNPKSIEEATQRALNLDFVNNFNPGDAPLDKVSRVVVKLEQLAESKAYKSDKAFDVEIFKTDNSTGGGFQMLKHSTGQAKFRIAHNYEDAFKDRLKKARAKNTRTVNQLKAQQKELLQEIEDTEKRIEEFGALSSDTILIESNKQRVEGINQLLKSDSFKDSVIVARERAKSNNLAFTLEEAIEHEYGHVINAELQYSKNLYSDKVQSILKRLKERGNYRLDNDNIIFSSNDTMFDLDLINRSANVSEYASVNGKEYFAESWLKYKQTGNLEDKLLLELFKEIEK